MNPTRRNFLLTGLFGTGWVGLRALATGLPASMFLRSTPAHADPTAPVCNKPQQILLFTSYDGDPMNANVPGTYLDPNILHPAASTNAAVDMTPTDMTIGGTTYKAAKPWATLPADTLARTCFFHHATYTNNHGDAEKVNTLMGAVKGNEMLVSYLASQVASCLGTIQTQPLVISNNLVTYKGGVMSELSPGRLQYILASEMGPLADLQKIRDTHLDQMNALLKQSGTKAQRDLLDRYALSQVQARSLSAQLISDLGAIKGDGSAYREDQNIAAAVLFKMNVSPVVVAQYPFGGDNHRDVGLQSEAEAHVSSLASLQSLIARLKSYSLNDQVTLVFQNVFGRTLSNHGSDLGTSDGRGHWAFHHCTIAIGAGLKGSVIGGVKPTSDMSDWTATAISSQTGASSDSGDIPYEETLGAAGKTIGAACGVDAATLDAQITKGKVVTAALA